MLFRSFDYRPYGTELQLCQRYYWKYTISSASSGFVSGTFVDANTGWFTLQYKTTMRATPTFTSTSSGFTMYTLGAGANCTNVSLGTFQASSEYTYFKGTGSGGGSAGGLGNTLTGNTTTSYLDASAEL